MRHIKRVPIPSCGYSFLHFLCSCCPLFDTLLMSVSATAMSGTTVAGMMSATATMGTAAGLNSSLSDRFSKQGVIRIPHLRLTAHYISTRSCGIL